MSCVDSGPASLTVGSAYSPWYDFYRDTFMENMSVSSHDLLRHFICSILPLHAGLVGV